MSTVIPGAVLHHYFSDWNQPPLAINPVIMKRSVILVYLLLLSFTGMSFLPSTAIAALLEQRGSTVNGDSLISGEIRRQLANHENKGLLFPESVKRFYAATAFQPVWFKPQPGTGPTWQARLLIDCAEQFGLAGVTYHQNELAYDTLHAILEMPGTVSNSRQARFDIYLTDAMIAYMNHLHYGRRNPAYPATKVDRGIRKGFHAEKILAGALRQTDLIGMITGVQPNNKEYRDLQYQLYVLLGVHSGDNYQVSAAEIKGMTVSMERIRWAAATEGPYIQVNIAAYTLTLYEPDSAYAFKIIVGDPQHRTPRLQTAISNLATSPGDTPKPPALPGLSAELPVLLPAQPAVKNNLSYPGAAGSFIISPQNRQEQQQFGRAQRDLSNGSIQVEHPEKLAALLLRYDGAHKKVASLHRALRAGEIRTFRLKKQVPVKITYLTYLMKDGELVVYKDIYGLDQALETALFHGSTQLRINY
jgi:murein L,D-transpeptidase YcbB/YkuD